LNVKVNFTDSNHCVHTCDMCVHMHVLDAGHGLVCVTFWLFHIGPFFQA